MLPSQDSRYTPLDLVTQGSWDNALFTTYALSLSFYETQLHKLGLARNGCRDIRIVADADGYQLSLSERQSHRVGNEYRLTPVALPNGVFHPKLIWLAGRDLDLVLIGSGNLTFGGFGKNLECLDVIRSDQDPGLFSDLGTLFDAWAVREDLSFTESDWLGFWRDRAQVISQRSREETVTPPALLHSSTEPIGDQLWQRVAAHGTVRELRSLSPFYDPDAAGILAFAEMLEAPKLTIGLLPGREERTTFPFGRHRESNVSIASATLSAPEDGRHLHAKIIEVVMDDGSTFVVSGSVNATRKSLLTSDNIETAILRHYPHEFPRPFDWTPCAMPTSYRKLEFTKAGLGNRVLVSGRLTSEGRLEGRLISKENPAGSWDGKLQKIDGSASQLRLEVSPDGGFSCPLEQIESFQYESGLQLHLSRGDRSGSGWVSVEGLLMAAKRGFLNPSTLLRLLGSEADESDESELLRYLATSAQKHLPAFHSNRRATTPKAKGSDDGHPSREESFDFPVDMLSTRQSLTDHADSSHREHDAMLNTYMRRIRQNLLRLQREQSTVDEVDDAGDDRSTKREEKERERNRKQLSRSLADYREKLAELSSKLAPGPARSAALCMWLEATLAILLRRLNEPDEAELFLKQWINSALAAQRVQNSSDILSAHVIAALLTLASVQIQRETAAGRNLGRIHEQLELFCGDEPILPLCERLDLLNADHPPFAAELLRTMSAAPPLHVALEAVQGASTIQQQIEVLVSTRGKTDLSKIPMVLLPAGKTFAAQIAAGRNPQPRRLVPSRESCPHCHLRLRLATLVTVERDRFGSCLSCGGFLLPSI